MTFEPLKITSRRASEWHNRVPGRAAIRSLPERDQEKKNRSASVRGGFEHDFSSTPGPDSILHNARVQACPHSPARCPFGGACHNCPLPVQRKPTAQTRPQVDTGEGAIIRRKPT